MSELVLAIVRHGEAEHNLRNCFNSTPSSPHYFASHLTPKGQESVLATASTLLEQGLSSQVVSALYSSPLPRTIETAELLIESGVASRSSWKLDERLGEVQARGMEGAQIPKKVDLALWTGESFDSVARRVESWYREIQVEGGWIIVVTHGTPATELLYLVTGVREKLLPGEARVVRVGGSPTDSR